MLEQQENQGFVQWVADNVDLLARKFFIISIHSFGFIYSISVLRLKERKKTSSIIQKKGINILQFIKSSQNVCPNEV